MNGLQKRSDMPAHKPMQAMHQSHMEEAVIRKIGVVSLANISGLVNAFIGLLFGIVVTIMSLLASPLTAGLGFGSIGTFAIIIFPIFYGIMGFISGAVFGIFYNLAAKIGKGVKLYS